MRLTDHLRPDLIHTDLRARDTAGVLRELATFLHERDVVSSREEVERGLVEREQAHSTAMGEGMALPHATVEGLEEPVLAVAISATAVQFGPPDTEPVHVFFVLLSPPGRERDHIKLLARICRLVRHPGFMEGLRGAASGAEALAVIREVDAQYG